MALNSGIQTDQIMANDDQVCIPRLSSILLAVNQGVYLKKFELAHTHVDFLAVWYLGS